MCTKGATIGDAIQVDSDSEDRLPARQCERVDPESWWGPDGQLYWPNEGGFVPSHLRDLATEYGTDDLFILESELAAREERDPPQPPVQSSPPSPATRRRYDEEESRKIELEGESRVTYGEGVAAASEHGGSGRRSWGFLGALPPLPPKRPYPAASTSQLGEGGGAGLQQLPTPALPELRPRVLPPQSLSVGSGKNLAGSGARAAHPPPSSAAAGDTDVIVYSDEEEDAAPVRTAGVGVFETAVMCKFCGVRPVGVRKYLKDDDNIAIGVKSWRTECTTCKSGQAARRNRSHIQQQNIPASVGEEGEEGDEVLGGGASGGPAHKWRRVSAVGVDAVGSYRPHGAELMHCKCNEKFVAVYLQSRGTGGKAVIWMYGCGNPRWRGTKGADGRRVVLEGCDFYRTAPFPPDWVQPPRQQQ